MEKSRLVVDRVEAEECCSRGDGTVNPSAPMMMADAETRSANESLLENAILNEMKLKVCLMRLPGD